MHPVLIVVDMQNGFVCDASRHVVPVIADLLDRWQGEGGDVVFTRFSNHPDSSFERLIGWNKMQGPPETDIVPELADRAQRATAILDKPTYTLFTPEGIDLVEQKQWTDLYICGIATESCVLKTAADAFERDGLTPWVVQDASASHAGQAAHSAGLLVTSRFIGRSQLVRTTDVSSLVSAAPPVG